MDIEPVSKPSTRRRRMLLLGCSTVVALVLLPAAAPAAGQGSVALFVGGRFGEARILALDVQGRIVASGEGKGSPYVLIAPCPGGERLAEVVHRRSDRPSTGFVPFAVRSSQRRFRQDPCAS